MNIGNILEKAQEAYDIAFPIPIDPAFGYKVDAKETTLSMLGCEIRQFSKSTAEIEVVKFQLSSTIVMLMLQFVSGSLDTLQGMVKSNPLIKTA